MYVRGIKINVILTTKYVLGTENGDSLKLQGDQLLSLGSKTYSLHRKKRLKMVVGRVSVDKSF